MKTKQSNQKPKSPKIYKTAEEALEAKHQLAKKFLKKIDASKIAAL